MNWLKQIKGQIKQLAGIVCDKYQSSRLEALIKFVMKAWSCLIKAAKKLIRLAFVVAIYLLASVMLVSFRVIFGWKAVLVVLLIIGIIWLIRKSFFAGVSYVTVTVLLIFVSFYKHNYFIREVPDSTDPSCLHKFRFEDIRGGERFFKENYPLGSDALTFLVDMTAAGARCKEYDAQYPGENHPKGARRIRCKYTGAFFSKGFMQEVYISAFIKDGKIYKMSHNIRFFM